MVKQKRFQANPNSAKMQRRDNGYLLQWTVLLQEMTARVIKLCLRRHGW